VQVRGNKSKIIETSRRLWLLPLSLSPPHPLSEIPPPALKLYLQFEFSFLSGSFVEKQKLSHTEGYFIDD
jgi:hypothetical protein